MTRKREKLFGFGRPRPLDRNVKARIMHMARALMRRTAKGRHYGPVTAKTLAVLESLLWAFHNAVSGLCFPSYQKIAEQAGCAPSTVGEAIKRLEEAGLLEWVNRIVRVRWHDEEARAWRWRVLRTSNGYSFRDPIATDRPAVPSKTEKPSGTRNQDFSPSYAPLSDDLIAALGRLQIGLGAKLAQEAGA